VTTGALAMVGILEKERQLEKETRTKDRPQTENKALEKAIKNTRAKMRDALEAGHPTWVIKQSRG
jgi:hypothetical protein